MARVQGAAHVAPPTTVPNANVPRLMQIKILYTFDDEKSTCLARCPYPVNVHTLAIDDKTQIGIVELRTCIQAIVAASPELVAKLGQDYTIYAYDYSEYETPLVGQGMLSWALASSSATPTAPADQSQTPVTGRVVNNARALFPNSGPAEMLQVKLRLVPVPTCLQSEYLANMQKYRDASNFSNQGFDPSAWTAFLRANPNLPNLSQPSLTCGQYPTDQFTAYGGTRPMRASVSSQQSEQHTFQNTANGLQPVQSVPTHKSLLRPATPKSRGAAAQTRPASRNSSRGRPPLKSATSCTSRIETVRARESIELDNVQSRKRAHVEQTDWQGPSAFEGQGDSLRVSASVAASVRGHKRPSDLASASDMCAAEPGIRPPTPRPSARIMHTSTSLAHETMTQKSRRYQSPYANDADLPDSSASLVGSPEGCNQSKASTPMDIPSSPPIHRGVSPTPSSPALPRLVDHLDSGFVSGALDGSIDDDDEMRLEDKGDVRDASRYSGRQPGQTSELPFMEETPGDLSLLPQKSIQIPRLGTRSRDGVRRRRTNSIAGSSPRLPPLLSSGDNEDMPEHARRQPFPPHQHPGSESFVPQSSHRAAVGRCDVQRKDLVKLEAFSVPDEASNDAGRIQGGSGLKRRKAIQNRMQEDIAAGEMPPYCHNCGEIDTPTWRKCFTKLEQGSPTHLHLSDNEDGLMAWEALSKSEDNTITSYRMIKKTLKAGDTGFEELKLCNACGMWLFKVKSMRPPHKWAKQPAKQPIRKRPSRSKPVKPATGSQSMDPEEAALMSALVSEVAQSSNEFALTDVSGRSDKSLPKSLGTRKRAASTSSQHVPLNAPHLTGTAAAVALQRAIQSSPPRFSGSKMAPIDLDAEDSGETVRRLLFPSPCKPGEIKTSGGSKPLTQVSSQAAVSIALPEHFPELQPENSTISWLPHGKHSKPSSVGSDSVSHGNLFKTPTRSSSKGITPRGFPSSGKRTRSNLETPTRVAMHNAIAHGEMTPFTAQLSALISEGNSDPNFNFFDMPQDKDGLFAFSNFNNNVASDDWGAEMSIPQSDGDFFPVYEDADMEKWNGGPLLEGELDELLRDAGEDAREALLDIDGQPMQEKVQDIVAPDRP